MARAKRIVEEEAGRDEVDASQLVDGGRYLVDGEWVAMYSRDDDTFYISGGPAGGGKSTHTVTRPRARSAERVWKVKESFTSALEERFGRIGKRAKRLSVDAPTFRVVTFEDEEEVEYNDALQTSRKTGRVVRWNWVALVGVTPMLAGWTFCGTLEHAEEIGTVVRTVPGQAIPPEYFEAEPGNCDHCRRARRRTETFVVRDEAGHHKQVGRMCVQDFLGGHDPKRALSLVELLSLASDVLGAAEGGDGEYFGGVREEPRYDIESALACAAAVIRNFGWVSRGAVREGRADGPATADRVAAFMTDVNDSMFKDRRGRVDLQEKAKYIASDADAGAAHAALEWARDLPEEELLRSEYLHNVHVMAKAGAVLVKHFGVACSIVSSHMRVLNRLATRKAESERRAAALNAHFGTPGAKPAEFVLTVLNYKSKEADYGQRNVSVTHIYSLADELGRDAVWFGGENAEGAEALGQHLSIGRTFLVSAKVKKHGDFHGRCQTTLTHLRVLGEVKGADTPDAIRRRLKEQAAAAKVRAKGRKAFAEPWDRYVAEAEAMAQAFWQAANDLPSRLKRYDERTPEENAEWQRLYDRYLACDAAARERRSVRHERLRAYEAGEEA